MHSRCARDTGCVSESGDFINIMKSKCFRLFNFNTYEHNVYIKEFRFFRKQNGDSGIRPSVAEPGKTVLQNRPIP
jgi:hypothetical protein